MKKLILIFLLLFSVKSFSQSTEPLLNTYYDAYGENKLAAVNAGKGFTGVASQNDVSGIRLNPASLEIPNKMQWYAAYELKSGILEFIKTVNPTVFVGGAYRFNKFFTAGINYYNDYSTKFDINAYLNNENDQYYTYITHTFAMPLVLSLKNFKFGVNLTGKYYKGYGVYYQNNSKIERNTDFWKFVPSVGFTYSPVPEFTFGASYSMPYQEKITVKETGHPDYEYTKPNYFPANIKAGIEVRIPEYKLLFDLDYSFANTSRMYGQRDRHDINFGAQYSFNQALDLRAGFFTQRDFRNNNYISTNYPYGLYNQFFLTFGASYKIKYFDLNVAYMDSHLINNNDFSHSRLLLGVTYNCGCPY